MRAIPYMMRKCQSDMKGLWAFNPATQPILPRLLRRPVSPTQSRHLFRYGHNEQPGVTFELLFSVPRAYLEHDTLYPWKTVTLTVVGGKKTANLQATERMVFFYK
jgi:hypothetical protein